MLIRLTCHDLSTWLVLLGLIFELGAVAAVARKFVSLGDLWTRFKNFFRKPEPSKPIEVKLGAANAISGAGNLKVTGSGVESREAPSLEAIHKDLRLLEKRVDEMNVALEAKLASQAKEIRRELAEGDRAGDAGGTRTR